MLSWQDEVTALGTAHCDHRSAHLGVIYILPYDTLPRDHPGSSSSCRASEEQGEGTDLAEEGGQEPPARSGPGSPPHPPDSHPPRPLSQFHHPLSVFHATVQASGITDLLRSGLKPPDKFKASVCRNTWGLGDRIYQPWAKRCPSQSGRASLPAQP